MLQRRDLKQSEEVQKLLEQGRKQGNVLTYEDINDTLNEDQVDPDQLGDILQMVGDEGIKVVEKSDDSGGSRSASSERRSTSRTAVALASEELPAVEGIPPDDSVRMYLREIGRVQLLTPREEVELAKQLERATILTKLQAVWEYGMGTLDREPKFPDVVRAIENFSDADLKTEIGIIDHVIKRLLSRGTAEDDILPQLLHEEVQSYLQHCLEDLKTKQMLLLSSARSPNPASAARSIGSSAAGFSRGASYVTCSSATSGSSSGRRPAARKMRPRRKTRTRSAATTPPAYWRSWRRSSPGGFAS
jgi:hypothetical protein